MTIDAAGLRRVRLTQAIWLLVALAASAVQALAPASQWGKLETICHPDSACDSYQLDGLAVRTLHQHGLSLTDYAIYTAAATAVFWLISYGLAALIIWRKPEDRGALLSAFFLILFTLGDAAIWLPSSLSSSLGPIFIGLLLIFCLLFPDGRFTPPWARWVALAIVLLLGAVELPIDAVLGGALVAVAFFLLMASFVAVILLQIYRFRSLSSWRQRQQSKWAMFGLVLAIAGFVGTWLIPTSLPFPNGNGSLLFALTNFGLTGVVLSAIPISIGISVLRSRLWDIDRIVSRALAYATLTAMLVGIYIGSVVGLQALFRAITGQQSGLAVAVSTLVIAALFNPLRRRLQNDMARLFSRRRYNAQQVLASFSAACRDETDLEKLSGSLTRVVKETVHPAHVTLWLRGRSKTVENAR